MCCKVSSIELPTGQWAFLILFLSYISVGLAAMLQPKLATRLNVKWWHGKAYCQLSCFLKFITVVWVTYVCEDFLLCIYKGGSPVQWQVLVWSLLQHAVCASRCVWVWLYIIAAFASSYQVSWIQARWRVDVCCVHVFHSISLLWDASNYYTC